MPDGRGVLIGQGGGGARDGGSGSGGGDGGNRPETRVAGVEQLLFLLHPRFAQDGALDETESAY